MYHARHDHTPDSSRVRARRGRHAGGGPGPHHAGARRGQAAGHRLRQRQPLHERRIARRRGHRLRPDRRRQGRPRRRRRRRVAQRARSGRRQRRLRRAAQRRGCGPAGLVLHARTAQARRRRRLPRRHPHAGRRGEDDPAHDGSPSAGRQGRAAVRAAERLHGRARPQHAAFAEAVSRVAAPRRSRSLPRSGQAGRGRRSRPARDGARRPDRSRARLRDDQLRRHEREGRDLRRDHDERAVVEDPGARRRLADPRRRALRRQRRRRRRDRPAAAKPISTASARS